MWSGRCGPPRRGPCQFRRTGERNARPGLRVCDPPFPPRRAGALTCQRGRLSDDAMQYSEARGGADAYQMLMVRRDRGRRRRLKTAVTRRNAGARLRARWRRRVIMESAQVGSRCAPHERRVRDTFTKAGDVTRGRAGDRLLRMRLLGRRGCGVLALAAACDAIFASSIFGCCINDIRGPDASQPRTD